MDIVSYSDCAEIDALEEAWDRLSHNEPQFVPAFAKLRPHLESESSKFRILVQIENSQIQSLACFIYMNRLRRYELATRPLFRLPVREVVLVGSCVLGQPSENVIRSFLQLIIRQSDFDLITIGDVFVDTPLYRAVTGLRGGAIAWKITRAQGLWWLIKLPSSFDEYFSSLSKTIIRDCKKCEKEGASLRVMKRPEDVDTFLLDAEKISRTTYQWTLGGDYSVRNDDRTRHRLMPLAKSGTLRCYIVYLRGIPSAFGWGELCHGTFVFEQTGFDPKYRRISPGTTLVVGMVRDLIENESCDFFDFKWGREGGYKSRYANISLEFVSMQIAQIYKPYSLLIIALDQMKNAIKALARGVIEAGPINQRLRAVLRRCGIGTF